ncbi:hypothetical protein FACS189472_16880 [Alphaproteobacteria bacterium]|nr:hypothetical protein FACS189472_16880 [Alphaproteobacteria bacterium]
MFRENSNLKRENKQLRDENAQLEEENAQLQKGGQGTPGKSRSSVRSSGGGDPEKEKALRAEANELKKKLRDAEKFVVRLPCSLFHM